MNVLPSKYKIIRIRSPTRKELLDVNLRFFILYSFCTIKKTHDSPVPNRDLREKINNKTLAEHRAYNPGCISKTLFSFLYLD